MALSYRELDIYQITFDLFIKTNHFSLELPKYELYELGSQLRRSSDSVNSNIVEGYGRKTYKNDFLRFLIYAHANNDETINHLKKLQVLYPQLEKTVSELLKEYDILGAKIYNFKEYVIKSWKT
jgi:four helix bundle protein